jgi:hypothetical protein
MQICTYSSPQPVQFVLPVSARGSESIESLHANLTIEIHTTTGSSPQRYRIRHSFLTKTLKSCRIFYFLLPRWLPGFTGCFSGGGSRSCLLAFVGEIILPEHVDVGPRLRRMALVRGSANVRYSVFDLLAYLVSLAFQNAILSPPRFPFKKAIFMPID